MAKDVCSKMAEEPYLLNEDGYLNADTDVKEIVYHPSLNVILICTNSGIVRVLDVSSGVVLQSSNLSALNQNEVTCRYIAGQDRILFSDGQAIGVRSDYNGVLLLDSILQKPTLNPKDEVKIELPLSEAIMLEQSLMNGYDLIEDELSKLIEDAHKQKRENKKGIKAQKWNTVCLTVPLEDLRTATMNSVAEMLLKNHHCPELGVASAVQERLSELSGEQVNAAEKRAMASECRRRETFSQWPHMDYKWALPDQMAQAGFYHQPNASGDDRAMCFTCAVCLVCWERTDEPWSEHERHSPNCPFVMGEYTQNVPLAVTHATNPAIDATYRGSNVRTLGTTSVPNLLPTANGDGLISVFDVSGKISRTHSFFVTQFDSHILEKFTADFGTPGTWTDSDDLKFPTEKQITALSIVSDKNSTNDSGSSGIRPTIICGLTIRCKSNKIFPFGFESMNEQQNNMITSTPVDYMSCHYLVVYDFMYTKEQEDVEMDTKPEWQKIENDSSDNSKEASMSDDNQKISCVNVQNLMDTTDADDSLNVNIMKHISSFYKTLIPGESDEVFLPPVTCTVPGSQSHSGPRLLSPDTIFINHDYSFMNGHIFPDTLEKSISDHITELKNSKSSKKLNYSRAVLCISIPEKYKNVCDSEISDIMTTHDNRHILVVVKSSISNSVLLIYKLNFSNKMVTMEEEPELVRELEPHEYPVEVRLLPAAERVGPFASVAAPERAEGNAVLVCADGIVRIVDLATLRTSCFARLDSERFVSAAYCNRLERLCASTESGSLHFYALNDSDNESLEDHEDEDLFSGINTDYPSVNNSSQFADSLDGCEITRCFNDTRELITPAELKKFQLLTAFEPLKTGFSAVVPPCWSEVQQAQRLRKHLHNLKTDYDQYTKTWRLQTDITTWDEHLFEITLPSATSLGHIDIQFNLQPGRDSVPLVEVTLLRQVSSGIGHKKDVKFSVDENIKIDMLRPPENPVIFQEYLRAHNAEILAGPIDLASSIDLSDQSGVITLTSPKLFRSKIRTFLVHVTAVYMKDDIFNSKGKKTEKSKIPQPGKNSYFTKDIQKFEMYMGCDCIHELSVIVYTSKHTEIMHERSLRNLMLESNAFIESLAHTAINSSSNEVESLVLDILTWIASVRLSRNRSNNSEAPNHQFEFLAIMEINVSALLQKCLLLGNRTISHKCMKLIITCCSGALSINEPMGNHFNSCVLNSLLTLLDSISEVKSAGGLQWLFMLLLQVTSKEQAHVVTSKCVNLLTKVANELHNRTNPYHLLLRSRYGLYGSPMEPELFDIDPPSVPNNGLLTGLLTGASSDYITNHINKESINPREVMSTSSEAKLKYKNVVSNKMLKGLIETEPLHFTCVAASDGTRLEQADSINPGQMSYTITGPNAEKKYDNIHKYLSEFTNYITNDMAGIEASGSEQKMTFSEPICLYYDEDGINTISEIGKPMALDSLPSVSIPSVSIPSVSIPSVSIPSVSISANPPPPPQPAPLSLPPFPGDTPHPGYYRSLLTWPGRHAMVVERMHSGARRHVTLDLGQPVLLTDLIMPPCPDLVSVSVDVWLRGEETDGVRLVTVQDIGSKEVVMGDLQPAALCRYVKITTVGRYGMSTTRCRIPIGYFYGHVVILPEEIPPDLAQHFPNATVAEMDKQRVFLSKLFEDISCKYSLACSKLKELLQPYLIADMKNAAHLSSYIGMTKDKSSSASGSEHVKVHNAYQEAITYQRQLNTVRSVISRIETSLNPSIENHSNVRDIPSTSTDKLRSIAEGILDVLLTLNATVDIEPEICQNLFKGLCVSQTSRLQFLAATFLDKLCGQKCYWGNFLADSLVKMFATNYSEKFPQDRVFILLAYLGRKSPERSAIIDSALRVVYQTLVPLRANRKALLAVSVDLPLLSWLLMYLSLQLDLSRGDQTTTRWDWVFGEMNGKTCAENVKNNMKKPYKRVNSQFKHIDSQGFVTNTSLPIVTVPLGEKLSSACVKGQELILMKKTQKNKALSSIKNSLVENIMNAKKFKETTEPPPPPPPISVTEKVSFRAAQHIDTTHCLAVAKELLNLILCMDHSSSADMLLLAFKVMSRLVVVGKIKLGYLMNEDQLLCLVKFCLATKIPWAPHALTCFLQDVLDFPAESLVAQMETDSGSASTSWANDFIEIVPSSLYEQLSENILHAQNLLEAQEKISKQDKNTANNNNNQLPSVYETDDSDLEELMIDDFEKKERSKKVPKLSSNYGISAAIDARLDLGVEASSEILLRKLVSKNNQLLMQNISSSPAVNGNQAFLISWPISLGPFQPESTTSNRSMLTNCFEELFKSLTVETSFGIEALLHLWLTLNCGTREMKFDSCLTPKIVLGSEAISYMISAITWAQGLSLSTWCVALQSLTVVVNVHSNCLTLWAELPSLAACIVNHPDFVQFFLKLLSGTGLGFPDKGLAGPTLCKALNDFLIRLYTRSDVVTPTSKLGSQLKTQLLDIVCRLVQPSGPLALRQGPMDAQCKLLQSMYNLDYSNADLSIAMSILECTGNLVYSYIVNIDRIKCVNIGEKNKLTMTFSDIFASVLSSDTNKQDRPISGDVLLINLLRLVAKLVQTPFPTNDDSEQETYMQDDWIPAGTSQTDESKAEQIQQESRSPPPVPCLADLALQHYPSIIRLCDCLAACKSSSLCMLANVSQKNLFFNEPNSVSDALFQVLTSIAKKTTKKELLMPPLIKFYSQVPQLSEPLLWFNLQVLNSEEAITNFTRAGGVEVIAKSFVKSSSAPNTIARTGTISTVVQHFSGVNPVSDATTAIASSSTPKKTQQASIENKLSLINFAPCCTISCLSGTAQPADILIQGGAAAHRRARTPQWSYHFYPEEAHTDLVLQLPSAILLREVHLQPHSSALATCPSAVSLEISAYGLARLVPACPPLPTSGMTFIRLHLPVPEIVNTILIRLYKPRDSSNIGLSQIRIMGNTAFGGNIQQNLSEANDDECHTKHSVGWLRLLHHCFVVPTSQSLVKEIIASAAKVPDLLTTCCGLLLVPSHVLPVYLPCLEKVLRELSLYNLENGVKTIQVLLESKSSIIEPFTLGDITWQDRLLINATGYQSACELLYQICEHQDEHTSCRVSMILEWLKHVTEQAYICNNTDECIPAYISSIASILWTANQSNINYDLKSMITVDFFDGIYNLKLKVENNKALKYSLDSLLCSLCYVKPEYYLLLLQKIGVLVPNLSTDHGASISDDRKDSEGMTDDSKETLESCSEWYGHLVMGELNNLMLSYEQLKTVALVSRSPTAMQQLLDSGLPKALNNIVLEFCTADEESLTTGKLEYITAILKFFTDVSDEKIMRDWLGSTDGSAFWMCLLHWLCRKPCRRKSSIDSEVRAHLEEVCVKFLTKCCLCHNNNQTRLARVLCNVMTVQTNGISGFMRRLFLQLLLENEKIPVTITADETLYKSVKLTQAYLPIHPAFKQTYNRALLYLSTNTTLSDILEQHIYFNTVYKMDTVNVNKKSSNRKATIKVWSVEDSDLSMAAGVTAKDKRAKDAKNQNVSIPQLKKKRYMIAESSNRTDIIGGRMIKCESYSDQPLPLSLNLGQLLRLIESKGPTADWPCIHLTVCHIKGADEKTVIDVGCVINQQEPLSSALQVFSSMGGLALLAQHLPSVYPETLRSPPPEKLPTELPSDSEWIKVEECDDIYEDIEETVGNSSSSKSTNVISNIPPHSLTAFGLFLRLPGYAEVLLRDTKKAHCLLRLVLGVTDDGEGGDIFQSAIADTLPTLPFEVLRKLYDTTSLSTDDGRVLRKLSINYGAVYLLLACLGIFTHQTQGNSDKDNAKDSKNKDERQLYWAKGTGFGTGSTQQSWNVEQALLKQKCEEEHVTVLLQVLASYINPGEEAQEEITDEVLPASFHDLLANSALLPALSSYLRNDSVLDMARHIPLYKAALRILRALAVSTQLIDLLLPQKSRQGEPSVSSLLRNMKVCVDTYASKLRLNSDSTTNNVKVKLSKSSQLEELEQGEGLATLMPDIQHTVNLVSRVVIAHGMSDQDNDSEYLISSLSATSLEEKYMRVMKNLQFGSYEMIQELPEGGLKFIISYHFENNVKLANEQSHPSRVKRIAQEAVTLSTSLPLSYSSSVFVRYDTSRLDVMKVLITGPSDTPYANGCFELDIFFPPDYPLSPMMINLETTGRHSVRFNPNLYNDGKVCLSVLNTWHGRPEEKWNAQTSSFLQVLVSIQSLILVPEPYFNEPGYERSRGTQSGTQNSREYNHNICQATVRWAMLEQILNPCPCFKDVIETHFYLKRQEILAQVEEWIKDQESVYEEKKLKQLVNKSTVSGNIESFKKNFQQLKEQLMKLKPPDCVDEEDADKTPTNDMEIGLEPSDETSQPVEVAEGDSADFEMEKMVNNMCE